jgi:hypothetical protein
MEKIYSKCAVDTTITPNKRELLHRAGGFSQEYMNSHMLFMMVSNYLKASITGLLHRMASNVMQSYLFKQKKRGPNMIIIHKEVIMNTYDQA